MVIGITVIGSGAIVETLGADVGLDCKAAPQAASIADNRSKGISLVCIGVPLWKNTW